MNYRNQCFMLLLLMMSYEALTLPAVDPVVATTGVSTPEESDKLPESNIETVNAVPAPETANATSSGPSGATEAETDPTLSGDHEASASSNEPVSIYASGLMTPEAFQQYLNQFGGAQGLAPLAASYPAPMNGAPGLYPFPGPIVVQTGYEGFLVPANPPVDSEAAADTSTTIAVSPAPSGSPGMNPLMAFASRLIPTLLMSTLFRIAAVVLSTVGIILFGGAITSALCRHTMICDIPSKAVDYLRSGGAQDVGRMLAEEITPERVRRTAEFVRKAINKYHALQKLVDSD